MPFEISIHITSENALRDSPVDSADDLARAGHKPSGSKTPERKCLYIAVQATGVRYNHQNIIYLT